VLQKGLGRTSRSCFLTVFRPSIHQAPSLLEQITAPVCGVHRDAPKIKYGRERTLPDFGDRSYVSTPVNAKKR
jgi:hypothetical protein